MRIYYERELDRDKFASECFWPERKRELFDMSGSPLVLCGSYWIYCVEVFVVIKICGISWHHLTKMHEQAR